MRETHRPFNSRIRCRRVKKALYIPVHLGMCAGILVVVGILMMRHHSTPVPVRDPIW